MLEKDLQSKIVHLCRKHAILAVKVDSTSSRGWPDLTLVLPCGTVLFVELKTPRGRLSELQKHVIGKLEANNANVYVIRSIDEFRQLLRTFGVDAI